MAKVTIKRGDTLSAIAARNNTTVANLAKANNISNPNLIYAGKSLVIPTPVRSVAPVSAARPTSQPSVVQRAVQGVSQAVRGVPGAVQQGIAKVEKMIGQVPGWVNGVLKSVPVRSRDAAAQSIPLIASALSNEGILNAKTLAYAIATVQHETAGTFRPIAEYGGKQQAARLGYSGGTNYYGRGFIQLTHDYNYKDMGRKLGMGDALLKNPELALDPNVSAKILARFFKDRGVSNYAEKGDFYNARRGVNGLDNAQGIANTANKYLASIGSNPVVNTQEFTPAAPTFTSQQSEVPKALNNFITSELHQPQMPTPQMSESAIPTAAPSSIISRYGIPKPPDLSSTQYGV